MISLGSMYDLDEIDVLANMTTQSNCRHLDMSFRGGTRPDGLAPANVIKDEGNHSLLS